MSFELVMAKRDRFGRKIGGAVRVVSADAQDLAEFAEKQITKGIKEEDKETQTQKVTQFYHRNDDK